MEPVPRVKWQWRSNSDPWSKTEEPRWIAYSPKENYLIEKAFHEKQKEVDLGDYIVSIEDGIQKKKGNTPLQRQIRRKENDEEEEMDVRSERYFETELPKSINKIFGSLQHFINFFSRRNNEILDLTKQLQEFEQSNNLNGLNKIICSQLISCLEEELLKPIEDQLKDDSLTKLQRKMKLGSKERCEELISLFKRDFISFEEFYGSILKSYTMNTALYLNFNKHLRNESWTEIENLLPYAICLCKAFFDRKLSHNLQKEEEQGDKNSSILLYRGTALDDLALSNYMVEKVPKLFSWNSVTSTSTNKEMAEGFMYKSANIEKRTYPVLFIIEIPLGNEPAESEYLKWIDVRQYSTVTDEDEVILPPGSAFELLKAFTDQEKRTTINLRLRHEVESLAHRGLIMQGVLQTEMVIDRQVKVVCLERDELSETFKYIYGNKLIEEIEFCLCRFNRWTLEEMVKTISSLDKAKKLEFISCNYEDEQGISTLRLKGIKTVKKLDIHCRSMKINYFLLQGLGYLSQIASLTIDLSQSNKEITDEGFESLGFGGLKYLTQLTSLNLNLSGCEQITNKGVQNLASQGLKYLIKLTSLILNFCGLAIDDEGVKSLASQGLRYLTKLSFLSLDFSRCHQIIKKGMQNLASQGLKHLTQLTYLALNFCDLAINDEGVSDLASEGLKHLTQLTSLSLNFYDSKIGNDGVKNLASQGLKHLTQLTSLTLDFSRFYFSSVFGESQRITDVGASDLASEGFPHIIQLTSLSLNFSNSRISGSGVKNLSSQVFKYLAKLRFLSLNFDGGLIATDEALTHFQDSQIQKDRKDIVISKSIQKYETKNLAEFHCQTFIRKKAWNQVTSLMDSHLQPLAQPAENNHFQTPSALQEDFQLCELCEDFIKNNRLVIRNLMLARETNRNDSKNGIIIPKNCHITSLTMNFSDCKQISNEGVKDLMSQGLKHFTQLTSLNLDFERPGWNDAVLETVVSDLASEGLKHFTQLSSLSLDFSGCYKITDKGIQNLASQGLKHLTQLTSLTLNLYNSNISDDGVKNLASEGLKHLTQLSSLSLSISRCYQITKKGIQNLASQGLKHLTQLTSLTLYFDNLWYINDNGVRNLASEGLRHLTQLTSLTLDFDHSFVTDEGVKNLASEGLRHLTHLTSLTLDFSNLWIRNEGVKNLGSKGLKHLTQLNSLSLDFRDCFGITDEGMHNLASQGLKYLTQLNSLSLDFRGCSEITDEGMHNLASQGLKHLAQINSLSLSFSSYRITGGGVNNLLSHGIKYLPKLTFLTLRFHGCNISGSTTSNIIRILRYFGFVQEEKNHQVKSYWIQ